MGEVKPSVSWARVGAKGPHQGSVEKRHLHLLGPELGNMVPLLEPPQIDPGILGAGLNDK